MATTFNTIPTKRLAATISGSSGFIKLNNILGWDGVNLTPTDLGDVLYAVLRDQDNSVMEIMKLDPTTIANNSTTGITILLRGMKFNGDLTTEVSGNKLVWVKNQTIVEIGTDAPQMFRSFVDLTGDQTIGGVKTFSSIPVTTGGDPTTANQLARKSYVDATLAGTVGTASDSTFGTVRSSKNQGTKPRVKSTNAREQNTPDKTLKIESFRLAFGDRISVYAGGNTPNFIDPAFGGDLSIQTNPSNGETFVMTVDGTACTFTAVSSIGSNPGNFLIAGSASATRANLAALINSPATTNANQVAFTGAQLTAVQKVACTDDLSTTIFIRAINTSVTSFSAVENFAGLNNTWTQNSTKNRYDLVVVDSSDTLQIRKGTESVSPAVPSPSVGDIPICMVLNRCGMTTVRDYDVTGQSYITDFYDLSVYTTSFGVPTGSLVPYGGSAAPSGWLLCDGTAVSRTTYASLFTVISTTYGSGDGSTTFNLPDLRSRIPLGSGTGTKVATFSSRSSNVITVTGLTNANNNEFQTGQAVLYDTTSGAIGGLTDNTTYYLVRSTNTSFSLATSVANAIAGTVITLSSDGSGTQTFTLTLTARTRGDTGGEETHGMTISEMPAHSHNENRASGGSGTNLSVAGGAPTTTPTSYGISTDPTGGSTLHSVMNPFVVTNYIIKS